MLGETLAVLCALSWAISVVLFKKAELSADVSPQSLNLFKNMMALPLLLVTMAVMGEQFQWGRSMADWLGLAASGVIGIAVGDTLYFAALRRLGPGMLAIVETSFSPAVVVFSILLLDEVIGLSFLGGAALILGGVVIATLGDMRGAKDGDGPSISLPGVTVGIAAAVMVAFGFVIAKPALSRSGLVEGTTVRLVFGVIAQLLWILPRRSRGEVLWILKPHPVWRPLLPGAFIGSYVAMLLWLGGLKYTDASIAALLNQLTVVFTIAMGVVALGERLTRGRMIGAAAALCGAILIVLTGGA
ncbi:MAG: DMT family transporter [Myxococcota bacterium]